MTPHRQTRSSDPALRRGRRALPLAVAVAIAAAGCGDTLVDHDGGSFVQACSQPGQHSCDRGAGPVCETVSDKSCGDGLACTDCTAGFQVANAKPICQANGACGYQCHEGWLRCEAGCCQALSVATGWYHTCAILAQPPATSGQLKCWGANDQGQLGRDDQLYQDSPVPVDVAGLASGVTQVAAGAFHTCAVQNGAPYCWGMNDRGQVGGGTTQPKYDYRQAVVNVPSGGFSRLAPGGRHTCAFKGTGEVFCWGANDRGQLGQGAADGNTHQVPLQVASLAGVTAMASGRYHSCAATGGAVRCWGANDFGQIGNGLSGIGSNEPLPVTSGSFTGALALAAGNEFSLAIAAGAPDPQLWGWGANAFAQLGLDPPPDTQVSPVLATISVKPTAVVAGRAHTCALKADAGGSLKCFGANDRYQLGDPLGNKVDVSFGVASPPVQVAAGLDHTCAVLQDGSLYCWGSNDRGQAGNGVADPSNPVPRPALVTDR